MKIDKNKQEIKIEISDLSDYLNALEVEMMREEQKNAELDEMSE